MAAQCVGLDWDIIGCVLTGELDLNTLCVDRDIFESGKKKLRILKYPVIHVDGALSNKAE